MSWRTIIASQPKTMQSDDTKRSRCSSLRRSRSGWSAKAGGSCTGTPTRSRHRDRSRPLPKDSVEGAPADRSLRDSRSEKGPFRRRLARFRRLGRRRRSPSDLVPRPSAACDYRLRPPATSWEIPRRAASLSGVGSAWRCTTFHSPFSRRQIVVTRSSYASASAPPTEAEVCSMPTM